MTLHPHGDPGWTLLDSVRDLKAHLFVGKSVVRAVDGVSLTIRRGRRWRIVGESGCGKSMTALAIMGLLPRPAGRIVGGSVVLAGSAT